MAKRQKMSFLQLEDLSDEVILKIFSFLDMTEILICGQVSKRLRAITLDDSLWLKLNFLKRKVPFKFLEKASENGCKYLSVAQGGFPDWSWTFKRPLNFKYLVLDSKFESGFFGVPAGLLENCHSLEKLSLEGLMLTEDDFKHLAQNGQTLKVLNLEETCGRPDMWSSPTNCIQYLFRKCVNLTELNFSNAILGDEHVTVLINNITHNILKLDISGNEVNDEHIEILVKRCNKITELNLRCTLITKVCIRSIVTHLSSSLEKINVGYTRIEEYIPILTLGSIKTLKELICVNDFNDLDCNEVEEFETIQKKLPHISINKDYFSIASSKPSEILGHKYGFWEIRAKQQQLFAD